MASYERSDMLDAAFWKNIYGSTPLPESWDEWLTAPAGQPAQPYTPGQAPIVDQANLPGIFGAGSPLAGQFGGFNPLQPYYLGETQAGGPDPTGEEIAMPQSGLEKDDYGMPVQEIDPEGPWATKTQGEFRNLLAGMDKPLASYSGGPPQQAGYGPAGQAGMKWGPEGVDLATLYPTAASWQSEQAAIPGSPTVVVPGGEVITQGVADTTATAPPAGTLPFTGATMEEQIYNAMGSNVAPTDVSRSATQADMGYGTGGFDPYTYGNRGGNDPLLRPGTDVEAALPNYAYEGPGAIDSRYSPYTRSQAPSGSYRREAQKAGYTDGAGGYIPKFTAAPDQASFGIADDEMNKSKVRNATRAYQGDWDNRMPNLMTKGAQFGADVDYITPHITDDPNLTEWTARSGGGGVDFEGGIVGYPGGSSTGQFPLLPMDAYNAGQLRGSAKNLPDDLSRLWLGQQDPTALGQAMGPGSDVPNPEMWGANLMALSAEASGGPTNKYITGGRTGSEAGETQAGAYLALPEVSELGISDDVIRKGGQASDIKRGLKEEAISQLGIAPSVPLGKEFIEYLGDRDVTNKAPTYGDSYYKGIEKQLLGGQLKGYVEGDYGPASLKKGLKDVQDTAGGEIRDDWYTAINKEKSLRRGAGGEEGAALKDYSKVLRDETTGRGGLMNEVQKERRIFEKAAEADMKDFQGTVNAPGGTRQTAIDEYLGEVGSTLGSEDAYTAGTFKTEREGIVDQYAEDYWGATEGLVPDLEIDLATKQEDFMKNVVQNLGEEGMTGSAREAISGYEGGLSTLQSDYEEAVRKEEKSRSKGIGGAKQEYKDVERDINRELAALDAETTASRRAIRGFEGGGMISGRRGRVGSEEYEQLQADKRELLKEKKEAKATKKRGLSGARTEYVDELAELNLQAEEDVAEEETTVQDAIIADTLDAEAEIFGTGKAQDTLLSDSKESTEAFQKQREALEGTTAPEGVHKQIIELEGTEVVDPLKDMLTTPNTGTIASIASEKEGITENIWDTGGYAEDYVQRVGELETGIGGAEQTVEDQALLTTLPELADIREGYQTGVGDEFQDTLGRGFEDAWDQTLEPTYASMRPGGELNKSLWQEMQDSQGITASFAGGGISNYVSPFDRYQQQVSGAYGGEGGVFAEGWQPDFIPTLGQNIYDMGFTGNTPRAPKNLFGQDYWAGQIANKVPGYNQHKEAKFLDAVQTPGYARAGGGATAPTQESGFFSGDYKLFPSGIPKNESEWLSGGYLAGNVPWEDMQNKWKRAEAGFKKGWA